MIYTYLHVNVLSKFEKLIQSILKETNEEIKWHLIILMFT